MSTIEDRTASEMPEEDDLFFFETDHLALKGNVDYSELLKTLVILQSQRLQAIKDYEEIVQMQKTALEDPVAFVERIKKGDKISPDILQIAEVPTINWDKYNVKPHSDLLLQLDVNDEGDKFVNVDTLRQKEMNTFNKPWTTEEQKRLEELLTRFPPEPIEMHRFKKIAAALGTRTVAQVTSRVQKYFLKLVKMGLPVPGRMPKACSDKYKKCHPHQRFNHLLVRPSTFFPELDIPVKMDDSDNAPGPSNDILNVKCDTSDETSSNYLLPSASSYLDASRHERTPEMSQSNEKKNRLDLLKQIRDVKCLEETVEERDLYRHSEYTCDYCDDEPIIGTRWHCYTCDNTASIDFCTDCMISQIFSSTPHSVSHKFVIIGAPTKSDSARGTPIQTRTVSKVTSDSDSDNDGYQYDMNLHKSDRDQTRTDIDSYQDGADVAESDSDSNIEFDPQNIKFVDLQNHYENDESMPEDNNDFDFKCINIKQEY